MPAMERAATDVVKEFVKTLVIPPSGPPKTVVIGTATCFTTKILQNIMKLHGAYRKTVFEYSPISNDSTERMLGTIKYSIA